jgi:hypothetical protein
MKRIALGLVAIVALTCVGLLVAVDQTVGKAWRREHQFLKAFVDRATLANDAMAKGDAEPFHCTHPLKSALAGKNFFGAADAALLIAGDVLGQSQGQLYPHNIGADVVRSLRTLSLREQLEALRELPMKRWAFACDDMSVFGVGSMRTDFGAAVVPELSKVEGGLEGTVRVELTNYVTGEVLCRGSVEVTMPLERDDESSRAKALQEIVDQLITREFQSNAADRPVSRHAECQID